MPATTTLPVVEAATALPVTVMTRRQQIVHNQSGGVIYVGTSTAVTSTTGNGIRIAAGATATFDTGAPLWASAGTPQAGGLDDQTVVMEIE
jgi:hypothetical protein